MLTKLVCKDFTDEEKTKKAFDKFIESGLEKISNLPTGIPYFCKKESLFYLENKNVIETNYVLMNVFNIEFASTLTYLVPFIDLPWSNIEGKFLPNSLQKDLIKCQLEELYNSEQEIFILKEGFKNSYEDLFSLMIDKKNDLQQKDLGVLYIPCFDIKSDYKQSLIHYIAMNTFFSKPLLFLKEKALIIKIDSDLTDILEKGMKMNYLSFSIECLECNENNTYLLAH